MIKIYYLTNAINFNKFVKNNSVYGFSRIHVLISLYFLILPI